MELKFNSIHKITSGGIEHIHWTPRINSIHKITSGEIEHSHQRQELIPYTRLSVGEMKHSKLIRSPYILNLVYEITF